jgi:hypothetical protein
MPARQRTAIRERSVRFCLEPEEDREIRAVGQRPRAASPRSTVHVLKTFATTLPPSSSTTHSINPSERVRSFCSALIRIGARCSD